MFEGGCATLSDYVNLRCSVSCGATRLCLMVTQIHCMWFSTQHHLKLTENIGSYSFSEMWFVFNEIRVIRTGLSKKN